MNEMDVIYGEELISKLLHRGIEFTTIYVPRNFNLDDEIILKNESILKYESEEEIFFLFERVDVIGIAKISPKIFEENYFFKELIFKKKYKNILLIDKILDQNNFGNIIKLSSAFNVDLFVFSKRKNAKITSTTNSVSSGETFFIDMLEINSINSFLRKIKKFNYEIIGTSSHKGTEPNDFFAKHKDRYKTIIIGSESKGINENMEKKIDHFLKIKINSVESLNASVAASIILFSLNSFK